MDRETIQQLFIRVCRDSGFTLGWPHAAAVVAAAAKIHPMQVWFAMDSDVMERIANGTHPALNIHKQPGTE